MDGQDFVIKVDAISKTFKLPHEKYSSFKSIFINFYRRRRSYELQKALEKVSFEVKRGEFFGIVGRNGSGKSTLLKLLAGIYYPTKGSLHIQGSLTPFIELGVGFNPELTGRENVFLNGALLGFNHSEMRAMYDDIVEFAEMGKFMDQKLKNYSSGMQVRLAFSIAIQARSDILLIDEVLAVGDLLFQQKCYQVFQDIKDSGRTVVFVSHDLAAIENFCDRVLVLDKSKVAAIDSPKKAVAVYSNLLTDSERGAYPTKQKGKPVHVSGSGGVQITNAQILDKNGKDSSSITEGSPFTIRIHYQTDKTINTPVIGVGVMSGDKSILGPNTKESGVNIEKLGTKGYIDCQIGKNILVPGLYSIRAAIFERHGELPFDFVENLTQLQIIGPKRHGEVYVEPTWEIH